MDDISTNFLAPLNNGMAIFVMGVLFILSLSNFFLFFQNKKRIYLIYSLYTFFILLDQFTINSAGFMGYLSHYLDNSSLSFLHKSLEWSYNTFYTLFGIFFIDLKSKNKTWYKIEIGYAIFSFVLIFIGIFLSITRSNDSFLFYGFIFYNIILGIILGIPIIYYAFKYNNRGNALFIIGSLLFILFSLCAFFFEKNMPNYSSWIFFYVGVVLENIFFTLALGKRQKIILEDKNRIQSEFIEQLKENERLKEESNIRLEEKIQEITKEIGYLNKQAKDEEVNLLKINYEKRMADLKVQALQAQMNPHFIFNSLNSIKLHIINNEKEEAVYYLNKFSKLIRTILSTMRKKSISLSEELQTMGLYVEIEKIRFSDKLFFEIYVDSSVNIDTIKLPPLILQPFVENAIWHGLSPSKNRRELRISVRLYNETHVEISICDNGIGREKSWELNAKKTYKRESIGIILTKERLASFSEEFENDYFLKFIDNNCFDEGRGTQVILRLPIV